MMNLFQIIQTRCSHNYKAVITKPTCTEFGHTTYTCADCGDSYVADYTDKTEHNYDKKVIPPTCTEHGYTVYTCPDCGKEYIGDLTDCEKHTYKKTVVRSDLHGNGIYNLHLRNLRRYLQRLTTPTKLAHRLYCRCNRADLYGIADILSTLAKTVVKPILPTTKTC